MCWSRWSAIKKVHEVDVIYWMSMFGVGVAGLECCSWNILKNFYIARERYLLGISVFQCVLV